MVTTLFPLIARGAETRRQGKTLVGPVDLDITGDGITTIIGPNGSGKTSLLRLLSGAARLNRGTITWACGTDEARLHQSFVFQRPVMLRRSVVDNLVYPLRLRNEPKETARAKAETWAETVGLSDMLHRAASGLSGGEQQKLALARALITDPKVVFLDEPTAALDGRSTADVERVLKLAKSTETSLIMTTHDMGQVRRLADRVVFLLRGRIHETADAADFLENPQTEEAQAFLNGDIVE